MRLALSRTSISGLRGILVLGLSLALFGVGCGGNDIGDYQQLDLDAAGNVDAAPTIDTAPAIDTAPTIDAPPDTPDALEIDAIPPPDADPEGQIFCDRYETLCGYDLSPNRFDDEAACLIAYDSFDPDQQTCVEGELDQLELDSDLGHCRIAMGRPPCN